MIWEFVPEVLILLGFGGVLFVLARRAKSLSDEDVRRAISDMPLVQKLRKMYQQGIQPRLNARTIEDSAWLWLEKTLRSVRIVNFKVENWVTQRLESVKQARSKEQFDSEYWFSVHKLLVEKKIEELFGNVPVKDIADPVRTELSLKRKRKEPLVGWLNLVRWYLEANHISEARRVLILCWQKNPSDERVLALLEMLIVKTEEGGDVPMPRAAVEHATPETAPEQHAVDEKKTDSGAEEQPPRDENLV